MYLYIYYIFICAKIQSTGILCFCSARLQAVVVFCTVLFLLSINYFIIMYSVFISDLIKFTKILRYELRQCFIGSQHCRVHYTADIIKDFPFILYLHVINSKHANLLYENDFYSNTCKMVQSQDTNNSC